jgi:predicted SAM-dependent methyltransferase
MMFKILRKVSQSFGVVWYEIYSLACCLAGLIKVKLFFSKTSHNRLEIGAGISKKDGIVTSDLDLKSDYPFDLRVGLPFPDESVEFIYAEHVLEHFQYRDVQVLLGECKRVMKPGAVLKVSVPDARVYLDAYCKPDGFDYRVFCTFDTGLNYKFKINYVNYMFYMGGHHRHMFDEESLLSTLKCVGFDGVCVRVFDADLDQKVRQYESIYAQCVKK